MKPINRTPESAVLALMTHEMAENFELYSMWAHVQRNEFELAMTCQLMYLVNRSESTELYLSLSDAERQLYIDMCDAATYGRVSR